MICNKCGKKLPDDSTFCQYCGNKIEPTTAEADSDSTSSISKEEAVAMLFSEMATRGKKAVFANKEHQPQNETDSQFGLVPEKPIYTAGIDEQERYLKSLRTANGEPIKWDRRGSMSVNGVHGLIDIYDIYLMSGAEYKTIYINMYGASNSTMAPRGFVLKTSTKKAAAVQTPKQKEPKARKPKKPVNKKLVVCLTAIPIVIVSAALLMVFWLIPESNYNHAKKLLENGNYDLAYSEFEKLDGYSDSENMMLECRYLQAVKYRDAGDYELANKIFDSLGNYKDSKILIHKHDYRVVSRTEPTCTASGTEVYKCSGCQDSYTEYLAASHKYVLTNTTSATCTAPGSKSFECSSCHNTYSEKIQIKSHSYSAATCTKPKTCSTCGRTEGTALGHTTSSVKCLRCGQITFQTLTYSGKGSKVIKNIVVPDGQFMITGYATSTNGQWGNFYVDIYYSSGIRTDYWIESTNSYLEKAVIIRGAMSGGYIQIDAGSNISWTITIEAVVN